MTDNDSPLGGVARITGVIPSIPNKAIALVVKDDQRARLSLGTGRHIVR
ncbi:hypothetical protein [Cryobacterium sp. Y57]|nr:hypothetical protein [Cryobacterium sp. Y57]